MGNLRYMHQLTEGLHEVNPYGPPFRSVIECALGDHAPTMYHMVIFLDTRRAFEPAR